MASLAIVTSSPPLTEGGHMVIARSLVRAAEEAGHHARLVVTPDYGFGNTLATYRANRATPIDGVDQVISLRYPSFAVRHPRHVCWLNHTMREYYDLWPRFSSSLPWKHALKEQVRRRLLHGADRWLLRRNVTKVVAQSQTIQQRLASDFSIAAEVVRPPAPQRAYRCDRYGSDILVVSRLTPFKRVDMVIKALAEPVARHVRVVIAGDGDSRAQLEELAATRGVADRVRFLGHVNDEGLVAQLAICRAVCFTPLAEDYGFVTIEAFASRKPVITCTDSGGPTELVADGQTGLVTAPTPAAIAGALARLVDDAALAESMGGRAADVAARMTWDAALRALLIV